MHIIAGHKVFAGKFLQEIHFRGTSGLEIGICNYFFGIYLVYRSKWFMNNI
jgi:hypothetical protein